MKRILLIGIGCWGVNHLHILKSHQLEFPPEEPPRAELASFIDAIEKRNPSRVDGWAGFHAARVVEAALKSAQTGAWIEIE
jgi:predicted dehydrogenase